jgi:Holliday junction resolvasome RuvABC DNA-binding subunit
VNITQTTKILADGTKVAERTTTTTQVSYTLREDFGPDSQMVATYGEFSTQEEAVEALANLGFKSGNPIRVAREETTTQTITTTTSQDL